MGFLDSLFPKFGGNVKKLYKKAVEKRKAAHFREAIRLFDKIIKIDPKHADAHAGKGNCLIGRGQYREALACFEKALDLDPQNANTWRSKGIALRNLGSIEEYEECVKKAEEIIEAKKDWKNRYDRYR